MPGRRSIHRPRPGSLVRSGGIGVGLPGPHGRVEERPDPRPVVARWRAGSTAPRTPPVTPSMDSRIRSAWPLCRAYSSIMCTRIQRRLNWPSPGVGSRATESRSSPPSASACVDDRSEAATASSKQRRAAPRGCRRRRCATPSRGRRPSRRRRHGSASARCRAARTLNQWSSTSARCLSIPPSVIVDGGERGAELVRVRPVGLQPQRVAVVVEEGAQRGRLVGGEGRVDAVGGGGHGRSR